VKIEVSIGELLDKYSILEIKRDLLSVNERAVAIKELSYLKRQAEKRLRKSEVRDLYEELKKVNRKIWSDMEVVFNSRENKNKEYFEAVESSIILNMQRAYLKMEINTSCKSKIFEVKSYFAKE
jgi:hypothetical protein